MTTRKPDDPTRVTTDSAQEGFYARWSRRKRGARDIAPTQTTPVKASPVPGDSALPPVAADEQAAALTDADMPPLESLNEESDYSGFMSPQVSEELRHKALRKLFLSPVFNVTDGLDDYDDDFTQFEALGDIITSDMRHQQQLAEQRAQQYSPVNESQLSDDEAQVVGNDAHADDTTQQADLPSEASSHTSSSEQHLSATESEGLVSQNVEADADDAPEGNDEVSPSG